MQSLARGFLGQPMRSEMAQLLIDQWQQLIGGMGIAMLDGIQDARDVTHGVWFMESLLSLTRMHWDHEPQAVRQSWRQWFIERLSPPVPASP